MVAVVLHDQMCAAMESSFGEEMLLELSSTSEKGVVLLIYLSKLAENQFSIKLFK